MKKNIKNLIKSYKNSKQKLEEAILLAGNRFTEINSNLDYIESPTEDFSKYDEDGYPIGAQTLNHFEVYEGFVFAAADWSGIIVTDLEIPNEYFDLSFEEYSKLFYEKKVNLSSLIEQGKKIKQETLEKQEKELLANLLAKYGTPN